MIKNEELSRIILNESIRNLKKEMIKKIDEISDSKLREKMQVLTND